MTLSLVTLHYEQPDCLNQFLIKIVEQTKKIDEVIVVDDGSSCELDLPAWVTLLKRKRHPRNFPQWSSCVNAGVATAHGDKLLLVWCNWMLGQTFVEEASKALSEDNQVVWCAPHGEKEDSTFMNKPQWFDNRGNYALWRCKWLPWEEAFDRIGGIHAVVTWIWEMTNAGMSFNYRESLPAIHVKDAPYDREYVTGDTSVSWTLCKAIMSGDSYLRKCLVDAL